MELLLPGVGDGNSGGGAAGVAAGVVAGVSGVSQQGLLRAWGLAWVEGGLLWLGAGLEWVPEWVVGWVLQLAMGKGVGSVRVFLL